MTDVPALPLNLKFGLTSRSVGIKLMVVCGLALLMMIPALFVNLLVEDRTERAADVVKEISSHVGGQQTFLGPTLAIPFNIPPRTQLEAAQHGIYLVFPTHAAGVVQVTTQERRRSLFKVPVFQADLKLDGVFDLAGVPAALPANAELDWSRSEIVVGVSDARGALSDATVTFNGKTAMLVPAQVAQDIAIDGDTHQRLMLLGTKVQEIASNMRFNAATALRFSGAQRIAVLAYGKTTQLAIQGDWRSPGFDGGFLPVKRALTSNGFNAEWSVPFIARGVRAEGPSNSIVGLDTTGLGVSFIEVADPYQSVNRSMKYLPLFIGLVFLAYFVFEATVGKPIHPAQYVLVGIAQIIFYLLLLSWAERIGFGFGFLIGGAATVVLLSSNAAWIFASRKQGIRALAIFSLLYTFIYMLLRLEDNALLLGAIASFLAVAAAMYFTRDLDWYGTPAKKIAATG